MELEYKKLNFECKVLADAGDGFFRIKGKASVYGNVDSYNDVIEPGAFAESLKKISPIALWAHSMREPIGVFEEIDDTPKALDVVMKLPMDDTFVTGRVMPQVQVGSIKGMSVGFSSIDVRWEDKKDKPSIRYIEKANLYETSLVAFGANDKAKITGFKSMFSIEDVEEIKTKRDFEKFLRDSGGFSKKAIAYLASCLDEKKMRSDSVEISNSAIDAALSQIKNITKNLKGF